MYRLAVLLFFLIISWQPVFADPPLPQPVARVIWIKGNFKAIMENKEERSLQPMSIVYAKDTLVTDAASQAQITFTDKTKMTFRTNTRFVIDTYAYAPNKAKGSVGKFIGNVIQGGFRTITGLISKRSTKDYNVKTPVATIGVRGTDFDLASMPDGKTYIQQRQGSPTITNSGLNKKELVLSDKSKYAEVDSADMPPKFVPTQPAAFDCANQNPDCDLKIENKDIQLFEQIGNYSNTTKPPSGPIQSFCISQ